METRSLEDTEWEDRLLWKMKIRTGRIDYCGKELKIKTRRIDYCGI
jgi:hypothetical protein